MDIPECLKLVTMMGRKNGAANALQFSSDIISLYSLYQSLGSSPDVKTALPDDYKPAARRVLGLLFQVSADPDGYSQIQKVVGSI